MISCLFDVSVCKVLFGMANSSYEENDVIAVLNLIFLFGKWYINICKCTQKELLLSPFINSVKEKLKILKMNYIVQDKSEVFESKYGRLEVIL